MNMIGEIHGCLPQAVCNQENPGVLETIYSANVGVAKGFLSISCCESNNNNCITIPGKKKIYFSFNTIIFYVAIKFESV